MHGGIKAFNAREAYYYLTGVGTTKFKWETLVADTKGIGNLGWET